MYGLPFVLTRMQGDDVCEVKIPPSKDIQNKDIVTSYALKQATSRFQRT